MSKKSLYDFFSGWIENAGVVPWFLSEAFLFLPIFFFLLALLFFVTRVLETIQSLLHQFKYRSLSLLPANNNLNLILLWTQFVKAKRVTAIALFMIFKTSIMAQVPEIIIMEQGEHAEISIQGLKNYSFTNSENISHKHRVDQNDHNIIFKAKEVGKSQLILWKESHKKVVNIFIHKKSKQSDFLKYKKVFDFFDIQMVPIGPKVLLKGEVKNLSTYQFIHRLKLVYPNTFNIQSLQIAPQLAHDIISRVYQKHFLQYIDDINCWSKKISIHCQYDQSNSLSQKDIQTLTEKFFIRFIKLDKSQKPENFIVKIKIIEEESLSGHSRNQGLSRLNATVNELFEEGLEALIERNSVHFESEDIQFSTIAEPQIMMDLNSPGMISVGSEIPFQSQDRLGASNTEWKFAGLKIHLDLSRKGEHIHLNYEVISSRPVGQNQGQSITGSREKASLLVNTNQAHRLFETSFRVDTNQNRGIPLLSKIPLMGQLFRSSDQKTTYKTLRGFIMISPKFIHENRSF